jgi:hypothetical protein
MRDKSFWTGACASLYHPEWIDYLKDRRPKALIA